MGYRPEVPAPHGAFQGEGLLAIRPAAGAPVHVFAAGRAGGRDAADGVPSIRAVREGDRLLVSANGPVDTIEDRRRGGLDGALARWADGVAARAGLGPPTPAPTTWCSWYHYFTGVTETDVLENVDAIGRLGLPVEVVQVDDGYQAAIGDWLDLGPTFRSMPDLVARIRATGRRAGLWVAPFLVGARSDLAERHPDWLVGGSEGPVGAGRNWDQELWILDTTRPAAAVWLEDVFGTFRSWGVDFFKLDFLYAGAIPGRRAEDVPAVVAYRRGLEVIRRAVRDAYVLGCGAPILPSLGLVDAMRVSPDTALHAEPRGGDFSRPGSRAAIVTGTGRAFLHGRFWVNDPDCLIVRPAMDERRAWAHHVRRFGGLRSSSDRLAELDAWGLETTRSILAERPPAQFVRG